MGTVSDVHTVLLDLDGVVWLDHVPIPGSVDAVAAARASGLRVVFVTNNSSKTLAEQAGALDEIGIAAAGDVVSSATAAALLVERGETVAVCGGSGIVEAVSAAGAVPLDRGDPAEEDAQVVMVGFHRDFDYERLRVASAAVRNGARFVATNDDATFPTPQGLVPGGGALVAAVAAAAGVAPVVAGKPYGPMVSAVLHAAAPDGPTQLMMIGDKVATDGRFAKAIGCGFALVRSGVTLPGDAVDMPTVLDVADLAAVIRALSPR